MNKKGVFLPIFVFSVFIILGLLYSTIAYEKLKREDMVIGLKASNLIKAYDEGDKINFFLEQSLKQSERKALSELYSNSGYKKGSCKDLGSFPILDSSCGEFNPEKNFEDLIKKEINEYKYKSTFEETNIIKLGNLLLTKISILPEIEKGLGSDFYKAISENNVNKADIENIEEKDNNLIIQFTEIELKIEGSLQSAYTIKPEFKLSNNLLFLNNFYKTIAENCRISQEECENNLKRIYSDISIEKQNKFLKIAINKDRYILKAAVDISSNLPNPKLFRENK